MNDDEHATLAATLALIDAEQQLQAHGTVLVSEGEERASDPWAQRATRDRKRQRKEIEQLRGEVAALEAHATQLHKYFSINSSAQGRQCHELLNSQVEETAGTNRWFTAAVAEFKRLQSAMQQNWELKAALDEERSVSAALINIFQLQLSKQVRGSVGLNFCGLKSRNSILIGTTLLFRLAFLTKIGKKKSHKQKMMSSPPH